jgi:hypothetical protein
MVARYFFHLYNEHDVILDETGVEVSNPDEVGDAVVQSVREMQREQDLNIADLEGWDMRVLDGGGTVIMTVRLGDLTDLNSDRARNRASHPDRRLSLHLVPPTQEATHVASLPLTRFRANSPDFSGRGSLPPLFTPRCRRSRRSRRSLSGCGQVRRSPRRRNCQRTSRP